VMTIRPGPASSRAADLEPVFTTTQQRDGISLLER
jgi:hypothetical protein